MSPRSFLAGLVALVLAFAAAGVAPGSALASGWSIEATPTLSDYTLNSALSAVSCPLTTKCIAVGDYVNPSGAQQPLTEVWSGSAWTIQQTPSLAGGGVLQGVSCTSSTACTAVGEYVDSSGAQATLAEQWNGTAWSIQSTPAIAGASSAVLNDVSCPSAGACTAVGYYVNSSGAQQLLAEAWNGSAWTIKTNGFPASGGALTRISCSAQTACTALGGGTTLVERWNGTVWTSQTVAIPNTPVPPSTELYGVTCTSAKLCTAVGHWHYQKIVCNNGQPTCSCLRYPYCRVVSGSSTLAEQWNGSTWTIEATPGSGILYDVSCPTTTDCTAAGESGNPVADEWNGSTWSAETIPQPASGSLQEVSCTAAANCVAVGNTSNATLAEGWNGAGWSIQRTSNPEGPADPQFTGVSCPIATSCIAVGQYTADVGTSVGTQVPLGEGWDGTSWEQQTPTVDSNLFSGVSCSTATSCMAVGPAFPPDPPVAETWNGNSWTLTDWPPPLGAFNRGVLSGVSCPGVSCMAVGYAYNYEQPGDDTPLGDLWNGSGWTLQTIPVPAGANTSALSSVSCPTTTDCTAVGYKGPSDPLAENWNGTAWTVQTTPGTGVLTGVSCPTTDLCWAVGGTGSMVAEEWINSAWTPQSLPTPTGATSTSLTGVSCPSASDCVAVGSYTNSQGMAMTLAAQWNGASWRILPTPNPSDSMSYLTSVSCPTAQTCTAVGYYKTSNIVLTLAEIYSA